VGAGGGGAEHRLRPAPAPVAAALPSLAAAVEQLAAGMNERDWQWLAAALTALAVHLQRTALPDPAGRPDVAETAGAG
jgi:hypothetical protein